jgi:hypothetical protein
MVELRYAGPDPESTSSSDEFDGEMVTVGLVKA